MKERNNMKAIEVKNLSKTFKVKTKEKGLKVSLKSIFKPKYKEKKAVNKINFSIEKGEILRSNIIAVLFMGSLTYLYTCGFFWYFCPRQLGRIKETLKFVNYGDEHYEMVNIYDYYRNH